MDSDESFQLGVNNESVLVELINETTGSSNASITNYCGPTWRSIGVAYGSVHGFTSLIICLFGVIMNLLNLIVLTRRGMISPTNAILTGLAMADLLNMAEYMPFALFMKALASKSYPPKTYGWALFVLVHSNFSQVCHTISIWLTVTLAVWRYIMVGMPLKNKTLCTMERAKWAVAISYISSLIVCIPVYLTFSIKSYLPKAPTANPAEMINSSFVLSPTNVTTSSTLNARETQYYVYYSSLAQAHNELLVKANFWIYSVVIKIIPCIVLTVVSLRLINSLMEAKRRKDKLMSNKRGGSGTEEGSGGSDRTTRMLLAVVFLFLMTEFPQGILGLLSGLLGESFFSSCYMPLGDLMDFIALSNSAINFILYASMSKKFRDTFVQLFHLPKLSRANVAAAVSTATTNNQNSHHFQAQQNNTNINSTLV